jgi:hypothetical protein
VKHCLGRPVIIAGIAVCVVAAAPRVTPSISAAAAAIPPVRYAAAHLAGVRILGVRFDPNRIFGLALATGSMAVDLTARPTRTTVNPAGFGRTGRHRVYSTMAGARLSIGAGGPISADHGFSHFLGLPRGIRLGDVRGIGLGGVGGWSLGSKCRWYEHQRQR